MIIHKLPNTFATNYRILVYNILEDRKMKQYKPRVIDKILERKLRGKGAVLIEGPKWCGKTTTGEQAANSVLYMADADSLKQNLTIVEISPSKLLEGATPRLIDEWQIAPQLWDAVRFEVDHRDEMGQFILTGSAVPTNTDKIVHTGTGRFSWLKMRTMSLYESNESSGEVSLESLFNHNDDVFGNSFMDIDKLTYLICRGGWPKAIDLDKDIAFDQTLDYFDAVINTDISRVDEVSRNSERMKRIMRSLSRHQGSQVSNQVIKDDIYANDSANIDTDTIFSYVNALKKIFVVEDMPAWNPNLRSKTAIRTSDTRYFSDPSIASAAMGIGPNDLVSDLNTLGLYFETLCVRDLRVYSEALDGQVYHYRDGNGLECDAVVHLRNGNYGLIEIKLGGDRLIDEGAANLIKLSNKIDTTKMKKPSFLMVLVGVNKYAYKRQDGVLVVPIDCLKN